MTKIRMERPRYFIISYIFDSELLNEKKIWHMLSSTAFQLFGLKGVSEMGLFLSKCFSDRHIFIVRVAHQHVDKLHAVLCCISQLENKSIVCNTVAKSGTLEKAVKTANLKAGSIPVLSSNTHLIG